MTVITSRSPFDNRVLDIDDITQKEDIAKKLEQCRAAATIWANVPVKKRVQILTKLRDDILGDMDALCECISESTGKVPTEALLGDILPVLSLLDYYLKNATSILADRNIATSPFLFPATSAKIYRQPFGVIAIISPWNYPFQLTVSPLLTALFAGNGVVFKASEYSLPVGKYIYNLFNQLDLPEGLVQWVIGDKEIAQQLIDAGPDMVFFTGGLTAGRHVMKRAAAHPIPVLLELGGKDAMIVFDDANLERASHAALYGAFCNSGQVCVSVERLYVQQKCHDQFLEKLLDNLTQIRVGRGVENDMGAMTTSAQIQLMQAHYDDAVLLGAKASGPLVIKEGNFVNPIVLWNVTDAMRIMREESFAPILVIMSFDNETEVVKLANDTLFGLNASVWSDDLVKAERVARQLQVGAWAINDVLKNVGHPALPFGGVKKSGFGRYHGAEGLLSFSYSVSGLINFSHLPKEPNWFPYSAERYEGFKGYLDFIYGKDSWWLRGKRNHAVLQIFRSHSQFSLKQFWHNLKCFLTFKSG